VTASAARRPRGRRRGGRLLLAGLVLVGLVALYGIAGLSRPMVLSAAPAAGSPGQLTVASVLVGCPAPGSGGITGGGVAQVSAPAPDARPGEVTLGAADHGGGKNAIRTITPSPGQLTVDSVAKGPVLPGKLAAMPAMAGGLVPTTRGHGGLSLAATGAQAQGFDAEQLGPDGQPTARCPAPGSDFWFVGPGSPKLHDELYLLNVDAQPADATLNVQTDAGPLLGTPDSGIIVPPHAMVVQNLDKLLRSARAVALNVTTSSGRVVAAVRQTSKLGPAGTWLPAAQPPATSQVLPGLPSSGGLHELYVTVPGQSAAVVRVTVVTTHGTFHPTGGSGLNVLNQTTEGFPIPSLTGNLGAVEVSANVPVTAVLEVSGGAGGAPGAFIAGAEPVTGQGVIAASPSGRAGKTELVLSAPGPAASVRVTVVGPRTPLTGQTGQIVHIMAKSSTQVRIVLPKGSAPPRGTSLVAIVVTPQPGSGPVYAGRIAFVGGSVRAVLPVESAPPVIRLPAVRESLLTVLGSSG
jgi:hypothetical protein